MIKNALSVRCWQWLGAFLWLAGCGASGEDSSPTGERGSNETLAELSEGAASVPLASEDGTEFAAATEIPSEGAEQEPFEGEQLGVARQALSQSFRASCFDVTGIIRDDFQDFAARCFRRNGVDVPAAYVGTCRGDIANCDGFLICGPC
jgi:hypothetical protein